MITPQQEIRKMLVTPAKAKEFIESNVHNRRIRQKTLLRYSTDMKAGRWKEDTFELIKISPSGRILDGQHRLHAIVKSNVSLNLHVAFGVPENVFDVLDSGSIRNAADVFKIADVPNDHALPSIIQQYYVLSCGKASSSASSGKLTNAQLLESYNANQDFWQKVTRRAFVWYSQFAKILPPSVFGGFYAHFYTINPDQACHFMDQMATGANLTNSVIALLRTKLLQDKMSIRKMPPVVKFALIIKAWNTYRTNKTIKLLKFDPEKEPFPIAQ